jgi:hypothetical protein
LGEFAAASIWRLSVDHQPMRSSYVIQGYVWAVKASVSGASPAAP